MAFSDSYSFQEINLDITNKSQTIPPIVYVKQNDSASRSLTINLLEFGGSILPITDPESPYPSNLNAPCKVYFKGINGNDDCYISGTIEYGVLKIVIPATALQSAGKVEAEVQILKTGDTSVWLSSQTFLIDVATSACVTTDVEGESGVIIVEKQSNKVTSLSSESTDTQYPSAKVVYNKLAEKVDKVAGKGLSTNDFTNDLKIACEDYQSLVIGNGLNKTEDTNELKADIGYGLEFESGAIKCDTDVIATKEYVNSQMSAVVKREIVTALPTTNIDDKTIYMMPKTQDGSENNVYDEWMYINNDWELIGSTAVDLTQVNARIDDERTYVDDTFVTHDNFVDTVNLKESTSNKVTSLSSESTDEQYPSAKVLYDNIKDKANVTDTNQNFANAITQTKVGTALTFSDVSPIAHKVNISGTVGDTVNIYGKNLCSNAKLTKGTYTKSGITYVVNNDYSITIKSGSVSTAATSIVIDGGWIAEQATPIIILQPGKYALPACTCSGTRGAVGFAAIAYPEGSSNYSYVFNNWYNVYPQGQTFDVATAQRIHYMFLFINTNTTFNNDITIYPMFNLSNTIDNAYEPYKAPQSLALGTSSQADSYSPNMTVMSSGNDVNATVNLDNNTLVNKTVQDVATKQDKELTWQLVEKITTTEELSAILRNKNPDGTSYSYTGMMVRFKTAPGTSALSATVSMTQTAEYNTWINYHMISSCISTATTYSRVLAQILNGRWQSYHTNGTTGEYSNATKYDNDAHEFFASNSTAKGLKITVNSGVMPIGSEIEIWGLK